MILPILEFKETPTPYGIGLEGVVTLHSAVTIPNYESHAIDQRKVAEGYVKHAINENFIRLRGYYKLLDARMKILDECDPRNPSTEITLTVLNDLINELQEAQFELKGNAK